MIILIPPTPALDKLAIHWTFDDNIAIAERLAAVDWATVDYIVAYGTNDYSSPDVTLSIQPTQQAQHSESAINRSQ